MDEIFGRLVKLQTTKMLHSKEIYGEFKTDNDIITFVIESEEVKNNTFTDLEAGEYYILVGESTKMDGELWETFEYDFPCRKPYDMLFVKEYRSGKDIADIFIF